MLKESFETWPSSTRDLYILLNLRIRQEILGRQLTPKELMVLALQVEKNVNEAEDDEPTEVTFASLERSVDAGLSMFEEDVRRIKMDEKHRNW